MMDDFGEQVERRHTAVSDIVRQAVEVLREECHPLSAEEVLFIRAFIADSKRKQERWERIKEQVLGWGVIALIGGIGTASWRLVKFWVQNGGPNG